jgi:predicted Zn-dependent protease
MKKIFITFIFFLTAFRGFSQQIFDHIDIKDAGPTPNFVIQGNSWDHRILTYYFQSTTVDLSPAEGRAAIKSAFATWQAATHISFIEVCNPANADIIILTAARDHGCPKGPFDGQPNNGNNELAHGLFPPPYLGSFAGDIHFDEDEDWTTDFRPGYHQPIDLESVALHEIGHSLGLAHSNNLYAVMYSNYDGSHRNLEQDDIDGIRTIYGPPTDFITGPSQFCNSASYTFTDILPPGCTYTWSTNNPLVPVSQNGFVTNNGFAGIITLTLTISSGCENLVFSRSITTSNSPPIVMGTYTNAFNGSINPLGFYPFVTNPACTGYYITTNMDVAPGATVTWTKISSTHVVNWQQIGNNIRFYLFANNQYALFQFTVSDPCGSATKQFKWQSSDCTGGGGGGGGGCNAFTIFPNPARGKVLVIVPNIPAPCLKAITPGKPPLENDMQIAKINVYNMNGNIMMRVEPVNVKQYSIDLSRFINGSYYVEVISKNGYREKQVVILEK